MKRSPCARLRLNWQQVSGADSVDTVMKTRTFRTPR
jgi:hypothetical protein